MQNTAKGQITLVSISDGSTALFYISENQSTQQIHNSVNGEYFPDYSADETNLVLTPNLTINGIVPSEVQYIWKEVTSGEERDIVIDSNGINVAHISEFGVLTIKSNLTTKQRFLKCTAKFPDPVTRVQSTIVETVVLTKLDTAGSNVNVLLDCTTKDYVENKTLKTVGDATSIDSQDDCVHLEAVTLYGTQVYSNGTIPEGSNAKQGAIKYAWSYFNSHNNGFSQFGTNGGASASGVLTSVPGTYNTIAYFKKDPNETSDSNYSFMNADENTWTVKIQNNHMWLKPDAIDVNESIRCTATLKEVNSGSIGKELGQDSDIQSVFDKTDDYQLDISATSQVLSAAVPSTVLTATITRSGEELLDEYYSKIYFDWDAYKLDVASGSAGFVSWPEYNLDATTNTFRKVESGNENGTGYWISGRTDYPDAISATDVQDKDRQLTGDKGLKQVTVHRTQVGTNSKVSVTAYLNGINEKNKTNQ